jgi:hypothetical protein
MTFSKIMRAFSSAMAIAVIAGCALFAASAAAGGADNPAIEVRARDGLIYVRAKDARLADLLLEIAEASGFELKITGEMTRRSTASLSYLPVAEAISRLMDRDSWLIVHDAVGEETPARIAKLIVIRSYDDGAGSPAHAVRGSFADGELEDQILAMQQVIRNRDESVIGDLTEIVIGSAPVPIQSMATIALGRMQNPLARDALYQSLGNDNAMIRRWAIKGLGRNWGEDAFTELTDAMLGDPDPIVRREAGLRIGSMPTAAAGSTLALAENDPDGVVRKVVRYMLRFREKTGMP